VLQGELQLRPMRAFSNFTLDLSFVGNKRPLLSRSMILGEVEQVVKSINSRLVFYADSGRGTPKTLRYFAGKHLRWQDIIEVG
jgi:hypothetical protein